MADDVASPSPTCATNNSDGWHSLDIAAVYRVLSTTADGLTATEATRMSVLRRPFANRWLNFAIAWEVVLLAFIIYTPFLQQPFGTFAFH
jgi:hypothetical protein